MKYAFLFLVLSSLTSCATSPEGRSQLVLLPETQMDAMGADAFKQMKSQAKLSTDAKKINYVKCITSLLLKQLQSVDEGKWEIQVFEDQQVNAFALPGRKIGVYTGLMKVAETSGQLAAVIGHEIGHVIANHGNERVSTALVAQVGLAGASLALDKNNKNHGLLMGALGLGAQFGVLMPHGRRQESEADMIGINLMARAGFDPRESVRLWQNMGKAGKSGPEWLSTHPSHDTRISQLTSRMDDSMALYQQSPFKAQASKCTL